MTDSLFYPYVIKKGVLKGIKPYLCQVTYDILDDKKNKKHINEQLIEKLMNLPVPTPPGAPPSNVKIGDDIIKKTAEIFKKIIDPTNEIYQNTFQNALFATFDKNKDKINAFIKKKEVELQKGGEEPFVVTAEATTIPMAEAITIEKSDINSSSLPNATPIPGGSRRHQKTRRVIHRHRRTRNYHRH